MFTNGTTNYNLPQWLPQDKPTWLGDMNGAFLTIDTNLKSVSDTATTASNAAANALTQIGTDDISSIGSNIKNAIINLNNLIGAWTSQLGADIATAIATIQQNITTINSTIGTWTSQIGTNIASAITTLKSKVGTIETTIGTWSTSIGTNIASAITTLNNEVHYANGTYTISGHEFAIAALTPHTIFGKIKLPKKVRQNSILTINDYDITVRNSGGYVKYFLISDSTYHNIATIAKNIFESSVTSALITLQNENELYIVIQNQDKTFKDSTTGNDVITNSIANLQLSNINFTIS